MPHKKPSESSILICGTARNLEKYINSEIEHLDSCTNNFKKKFFFVVESDSSDETVALLEQLSKNRANFNYYSFGNLSKQFPKRTKRLEICRNKIVEEVKNNVDYRSIDYVLIADLDNVNQLLTADKINRCWQLKKDWDILTANQSELYYDIWALRHPDWSNQDCIHQLDRLKNFVSKEQAENLAVRSKQVYIGENFDLLEVDSAFGGLGIYKKEVFIQGHYEGLDSEGNEICEHVKFHESIKVHGFKIYINPALINFNGSQDSDIAQPVKIKKAVKLLYLILKLLVRRNRLPEHIHQFQLLYKSGYRF
jgi:hypothetical protein